MPCDGSSETEGVLTGRAAHGWLRPCRVRGQDVGAPQRRRSGLPVLDAIEGAQTDTPHAHLNGRMMIDGDFAESFPVSGAGKDAGLIVEAMRSRGVTGEVAEAVRRKFLATADDGHADEDMAAAVLHSAVAHKVEKAA